MTGAPPLPVLPQIVVEAGLATASPVQPAGTLILDDPVNGKLDTATLGGGVTWSDISPQVLGFTVTRPSTRLAGPLWNYQAATASILLDNSDGRFDPDNLSGPYVTPAVPGMKAGAYLDINNFQQADWNGLASLWQSWTGVAAEGGVVRYYAGAPPYSYTTDLQEIVAAGARICISFSPSYNPPSAADLTSITSVLAALKAAGADCIVSVRHEPFYNGLTAAQYAAEVQFYAPAMRQYYPFFCVFSGNDTIDANGYYPGDAYVDGIAVDCYLTNSYDYTSNDLTNAAAMADNHGKPLGIWEMGTTRGPNFLTGDSHTFAATIGNWTQDANCVLSHSTAVNPFGTQTGALGITASAAGNMSVKSGSAASFATTMQACSPGNEITVGAWVQANSVSRTCAAGANFYTSAGVFVSTVYSTDPTATASDPVGSWAPVTGKVFAPAGAAYYTDTVQVQGAAAGEFHRVGMTYCANSSTTGHTQGGATTWWQWLQSMVQARVTAGKPHGDVILFSAGFPGNSNMDAIQYSNDYRIGLWQGVYAALSGLGAAPAVSSLSPMVPVRVRAVFTGTAYALYSGYADGWMPAQVTYNGGYAELTLSATDAFKVLAGITLPALGSPEGAGATTGARVKDILGRAGWWTSAEYSAVGPGSSTVQGTTLGDTALNLMQIAADSEIGQLYVNGSGAVTFRGRQQILAEARSSTVQAVFGDLPGNPHPEVSSVPALNPDPGFDNGTASWTASNGAVLSFSVAVRYGTVPGVMALHGNGVTANPRALGTAVPVTAGQQYTMFAVTYTPAAWPAAAQVDWHDSGGTYISTSSAAPVTSAVPWQVLSVTATAPAGAASATLIPSLSGTPAASVMLYAGWVSLVPGDASSAAAELACAVIGRASDDTTTANDIQATRAGGTMQEVKDAASIAKYLFPRSYARADLILQNDSDALNWAQWVLYVSKGGEGRFETLAVDPAADPAGLWPQVLGRETGDRIQVWTRPAGVASPAAKDCFIAGIVHQWDSVTSAWLTAFSLQDASKYGSFLTLDNATSGRLGSNALAF